MDIFTYPFIIRAIIAGLLLAPLLGALGIFVTLRKIAFFGEGIAHASLAGIAIAVLTGISPLPIAIIWAIIIALFVWYFERHVQLSSDTIIGIFLTASMAFGVVLMSFTTGYQPELVNYLFGSILSVTNIDIFTILVLGTIILLWLGFFMKKLTFLSLSEESAHVHGISVRLLSALLYVALAIGVVLGVKILGIILVAALLIIPPATARMLSASFGSYVWITILASEIMMIGGLLLSFFYDLPSGASIVLTGTIFFFLAIILGKLK